MRWLIFKIFALLIVLYCRASDVDKEEGDCGCSGNLNREVVGDGQQVISAAIPIDVSKDDSFFVEELGQRILKVHEDGPTVDMIYIEGGETFIGTAKPILISDGEGPLRTVSLSPYFIDRYSVTNEGITYVNIIIYHMNE